MHYLKAVYHMTLKGNFMFDSRKMLDLGTAFLNAGEVNFREGVMENRSCYQNVAGIVNLAFACELFIKCLLNMAGRKSQGHSLRKLWSKYKKICPRVASEIENRVMGILVTDYSFEEMLCDDSKIFYNYRYLYEPDRLTDIRDSPLRLQFLRVFAQKLYFCISNEL